MSDYERRISARWMFEACAVVRRWRCWGLGLALYFGEPWGPNGPLWGAVLKLGPATLMLGVRDNEEDIP